MRRSTPRLLAALLLLAVAVQAPAQGPAPSTRPVTPLTLSDANFQNAADCSASLTGHALLVMQDGKVLFERYDAGWTAERPHMLASGTKSFCGLLAAAAIEDGYIPTWDDNVSDTLPQWKADPLKSQITVRHLLSLSSGLTPGEMTMGSRMPPGAAGKLGALLGKRAGKAPTTAPSTGDAYADALALPMVGRPGKQFQYGPAQLYAFEAYLDARLNSQNAPQKDVEAYLRARITDPLGIHIARLGKDAAGRPNLPGGMSLTAREWAKLGQMVLDRGTYTAPDGTRKQLLRPELLAQLFKPAPTNPHYGLTWWLPADAASTEPGDTGGVGRRAAGADPRQRRLAEQMGPILAPDGTPTPAYLAAGLGKQRLLILPDLGLVIVRFAGVSQEGLRYSDAELVRRLLGTKGKD